MSLCDQTLRREHHKYTNILLQNITYSVSVENLKIGLHLITTPTQKPNMYGTTEA